jgi:hypothetical protein
MDSVEWILVHQTKKNQFFLSKSYLEFIIQEIIFIDRIYI